MSRTSAILIGVAAFLLCYGVPTLVEWRLLPIIGGFPGIVFLGNLAGCAIIAIVNRRLAVGLYATLTVVAGVLVTAGIMSVPELILTADIVPALIIALFAPGIVNRLVDSMGSCIEL